MIVCGCAAKVTWKLAGASPDAVAVNVCVPVTLDPTQKVADWAPAGTVTEVIGVPARAAANVDPEGPDSAKVVGVGRVVDQKLFDDRRRRKSEH